MTGLLVQISLRFRPGGKDATGVLVLDPGVPNLSGTIGVTTCCDTARLRLALLDGLGEPEVCSGSKDNAVGLAENPGGTVGVERRLSLILPKSGSAGAIGQLDVLFCESKFDVCW